MSTDAPVERNAFGTMPDGTAVDLYTLTNARGMVARIATLGGIITELHVPDAAGRLADVVLGFDNLDAYAKGHPFFGAIAGRYANRIAGGRFTLDGKEYVLATNDGANHLHGGRQGFDKKVWDGEGALTDAGPALTLAYLSPDGEEGYPGNLRVTVTYTLTEDALRIDYAAETDARTPLNLTNHSYFNLAGPAAGDILDHEMEIFATSYTPVNDALIPTGEIASLAGTPLDFRRPTPIGARIEELKPVPGGYDHNYVLDGSGLAVAARVRDPKSGRVMETLTTEPGMQFYTGNFLDGKLAGKGGVVYGRHHGFCLETQHFPDSPNHANFPSTILEPGRRFESTTVYRFVG